MAENICRFIPFKDNSYSLHVINFVFETKEQTYSGLKSDSVYKMYYVNSGSGQFHTLGKISEIKKGDIFFSFPALPFAIESCENLNYSYISFVGVRGNKLLDMLKISGNNFIFNGAQEIAPFWEKGILTNEKAIGLMSEAILLYTFSYLEGILSEKDEHSKQSHTIDYIKKYVDEHFAEQKFSLDKISDELSYNKKYISHLFKKNMGIGLIEYLNTIRIQNACTLMEQGFTSITDISDRCGFTDIQYFSKVFKNKMGYAPSVHIKEIQKSK